MGQGTDHDTKRNQVKFPGGVEKNQKKGKVRKRAKVKQKKSIPSRNVGRTLNINFYCKLACGRRSRRIYLAGGSRG